METLRRTATTARPPSRSAAGRRAALRGAGEIQRGEPESSTEQHVTVVAP